MPTAIFWFSPVASMEGWITWGGNFGIWRILSIGILILQNENLQRLQLTFTLYKYEIGCHVGSRDD